MMKVLTPQIQGTDLFVAKNKEGWHFEIQGDFPQIGAYLYVWDEKGKGVYDHLQDSVEICKEQALEEYGVPLDEWIKVE